MKYDEVIWNEVKQKERINEEKNEYTNENEMKLREVKQNKIEIKHPERIFLPMGNFQKNTS